MSGVGYFEEQAARFAALPVSRPEFRERYALLGRLIEAHGTLSDGTTRCVDLGCGTGVVTRHAAGLGYETLGIDASEAMLRVAREHTPSELDGRITYRRLDLPLSDTQLEPLRQSFELVVLSSVIEFVEEDGTLLDQCIALLAGGGVLIATFPNRRSLYRRVERLLSRPLGRAGSYLSVQLHSYDADEIAASLVRRGVEVRETGYFALPLQRWLGAAIRPRPPSLATMFAVAAEKPHAAGPT